MKNIYSRWMMAALTLVQTPLLAQTDVTNQGQIYMTSSLDTFFVSGSLDNQAGASLQNMAGNLYVKQNLTNNETGMVAGGGKLWFTGTSTQTVFGAQPFRTYEWIVDNPGVTLQNRVAIGNGTGGNLQFISGLITSGTNTQDVYFHSGSAYTGYGDAAHIVGYCSKSGSTDFTFPIGNGTLRADLDITNLSGAADFQCKYFGSGYGIYTPVAPLTSVFDKEYWTLDRPVGTASAQITLKWNDARKPLNHTIPAGLRVGHFTGAWISENGVGSGNTPTGTVTSTAVSSFSPFTFASEVSVLPLSMHSFMVNATPACNVKVAWTVQDETEVDRYLLQSSADGISWQDVQTVNVDVPVTNEKTYAITYSPLNKSGNWQYRIKAERNNGSSVYTEIKTARLTCKGSIKVYPTITSSTVTVQNADANVPVMRTRVFTASGQLVKEVNNPGALFQVNLTNLPSDTYMIMVETQNEKRIFKVTRL